MIQDNGWIAMERLHDYLVGAFWGSLLTIGVVILVLWLA